jgi:hypothetical protein
MDSRVTYQCKFIFVISANFIDKVEVDSIPLGICGVILGNPSLYVRDIVFKTRDNQYRPVRHGDYYIFHTHKR